MTSKLSCSEEQCSQKAERLVQGQRSDSPEPCCVSMKSDRHVSMKSDQSMDVPLRFRGEDRPTDLREWS
ncbi:hypothetical protein SRHO_G00000030 [Serrasalmus rhombeus]